MRILSVLMLMAYAMALTGCNTVEGFGQDVKRLGSKIENKAEQERRN